MLSSAWRLKATFSSNKVAWLCALGQRRDESPADGALLPALGEAFCAAGSGMGSSRTSQLNSHSPQERIPQPRSSALAGARGPWQPSWPTFHEKLQQWSAHSHSAPTLPEGRLWNAT